MKCIESLTEAFADYTLELKAKVSGAVRKALQGKVE
jgi:hypothetical protein